MTDKLSAADVELLSDGSENIRAAIALKIARLLNSSALGDRELSLVHDILNLLSRDISSTVRQTLAKTLSGNALAPHKALTRLANDVDWIAQPVLELSTVLDEEELIKLALNGAMLKQLAIASRRTITPPLADALVETGKRDVVKALLANGDAEISLALKDRIAALYSGDNEILQLLARQLDAPAPPPMPEMPVSAPVDVQPLALPEPPPLPEETAEEPPLPEAIEEPPLPEPEPKLEVEPEQMLELEQALPNDFAPADASLAEMAEIMRSADMRSLVQQLAEQGRLTPHLILQAACMGEMSFVEASFAQLAALPEIRAWRFIHDADPASFRMLYERTSLPPPMFEIFQSVLKIFHEVSMVKGKRSASFRRELIARILERCKLLEEDDRVFLRGQLSHLSAAA